MKRINHILILGLSALFLGSCKPTELQTPDIGSAPSPSDLSFTISEGPDLFHFVLRNTSSVTGMPFWNLGNGSVGNGDTIVAYYSQPDTYTISMSLYTNGGSTRIDTTLVTTETDWDALSNPTIELISGGAEAVNGKTWVIDSLTPGHLGVGPDLENSTQWWAAGKTEKAGTGLYDDEINFSIIRFKVTYDNKGVSYVKSFRKDDPAYTNARPKSGDYMVNYATPVTGIWSFLEEDGKKYLIITAPKPIYPCFDTGAKDGKYLILKVTETNMELSCFGGDGNAWHYLLKTKGS